MGLLFQDGLLVGPFVRAALVGRSHRRFHRFLTNSLQAAWDTAAIWATPNRPPNGDHFDVETRCDQRGDGCDPKTHHWHQGARGAAVLIPRPSFSTARRRRRPRTPGGLTTAKSRVVAFGLGTCEEGGARTEVPGGPYRTLVSSRFGL